MLSIQAFRSTILKEMGGDHFVYRSDPLSVQCPQLHFVKTDVTRSIGINYLLQSWLTKYWSPLKVLVIIIAIFYILLQVLEFKKCCQFEFSHESFWRRRGGCFLVYRSSGLEVESPQLRSFCPKTETKDWCGTVEGRRPAVFSRRLQIILYR
jgi:hypothetical protein